VWGRCAICSVVGSFIATQRLTDPHPLDESLSKQSNNLVSNYAKEAGKKYIPFTDRTFDPTSTWGQVEQRIDYWAQWVVKRVQALQGKSGTQ
jgi:hypothetical protein